MIPNFQTYVLSMHDFCSTWATGAVLEQRRGSGAHAAIGKQSPHESELRTKIHATASQSANRQRLPEFLGSMALHEIFLFTPECQGLGKT